MAGGRWQAAGKRRPMEIVFNDLDLLQLHKMLLTLQT